MHNMTSPRTDDDGIEQEIQAKGADKAPRVTPTDIEEAIASEFYFTAAQGVLGEAIWGDYRPQISEDVDFENRRSPLDLLTFCVLVLDNGFTVTGESAVVSPENFDAGVGRKVARKNAIEKVWPLLGYALKERLSNP